jgi:hypothetical protein
LDFIRHRAVLQRLRISITDNEVDVLDMLMIHMIYSISATTTKTKNLDDVGLFPGHIKVNHKNLFFVASSQAWISKLISSIYDEVIILIRYRPLL